MGRKKANAGQEDTIDVDREVETARTSLGKIDGNHLFNRVIGQNKMRVSRQNSLSIKDTSKRCPSIDLHLPKIKNKGTLRRI
jgi:hypothetical protein